MSQLQSHKSNIKKDPPPTKISTEELPVLKDIADAYKQWHRVIQEMPRLSRFTLGTKIDNMFVELIELLVLAGYAGRDQKLTLIQRAIGKTDLLKYFLQLIWEMKLVDDKKYLSVAQPINEVGKQLGGWRRQLTRSAYNT